EERPKLPQEPIWEYDVKFAGSTTAEKLSKVREKLKEYQVQHLIVHRTDDVVWLFNLRGADIPYNPVFLSFALVGHYYV
ncbi:unnamed protein product, partial [Didymodactylos carnosus]